MAASSNESFGLKIATALSIALSVVLLVSVYFLNSNYNLEFERRAAADKKAADQGTALRKVTDEANEYRKALGYESIEDFDSAKAQMKKDSDQLKADIEGISKRVNAMVLDFKKKADPKDAAQLDPLMQRTQELTTSFLTNADQSSKAGLARLKDLMDNLAGTTTALSLNYADLRRNLEQANEVNSKAKAVVEASSAAAKAELDEAIKKGEEARQELVADNRKKADELAALDAKITNLTNDLTAKLENKSKTITDMNSVLRDLRDVMAQKEDVMGKPGGRVTFVDYGSRTVRVNVNRSQGVRPLMRFTIFDKNAAGIPSDKPKATVELVKVGDPQKGENDSVARIVRTDNPADPIRYNDYIFSVGWSYDRPQRFDLIGKLDMNRDGKDDRADLIRMIEASGGVVEYDLPPPNVDREPGRSAVARTFARLGQPVPPPVGRASGRITGLSYAYVTDKNRALVVAGKEEEATKEEAAYLKEESDATKEARDNGVRPLPLDKLMVYLGYNSTSTNEGRREMYDKAGVQGLLKKKPGAAVPPPATEAEPTPPPADEPK
jgi:hypothetical protein